MRIAVAALLVTAAVLLAAGCGGDDDPGVAPSGAPAIEAPSTGEPTALGTGRPERAAGGSGQGITVVGSGSERAAPDVAEWSFGVRADAQTADAALAAAGAAMEQVLGALRSVGITGENLETEQVSVYPRTSSDGSSVVGYDASNTVHAVIHNLGRVGRVVDAAVGAGANEVYGPSLRVSDAERAYRAAVKSAFADARARAAAIAGEAGLQLGAPIAVVDGGSGGVMPYAADAVLEKAEAVPIEPGVQEIAVSLTVTFAVS